MGLLNAYIHPDDVKIIKDLAISRNCRPDSSGWLFIETGKYIVKSRYKIESLYPDKEQCTVSYGSDTKLLLAFFHLETEMFSKVVIFYLPSYIGYYTGCKKFESAGY